MHLSALTAGRTGIFGQDRVETRFEQKIRLLIELTFDDINIAYIGIDLKDYVNFELYNNFRPNLYR